MSVSYNISTITTDGLIFSIDSSNIKSYSGSGSNISDIVSRSFATLYNSPTYVSSESGYLSFNGSSNYATTETINGWTSISCFVYITDVGTGWKYLFDGRDDGANGWFSSLGIGSYWTGMYINGVSQTVSWANVPKNQWIHLYIEGNTSRTTKVWFFSRLSNIEYLQGRISHVSFYNKKLSAIEINKNFNALRGRYGI